MQKLVIFDLDRTIVRFGTYTPFLLWFAWHNAPHRLLLVPLVVLAMASYKLRFFSRKRLKEIMFAMLIGPLPIEKAKKVASAFAEKTVRNNCYDDALATIAYHKKQGHTLILATASFAFYAESIGKLLGFHHVVATRLQKNESHLLPRIMGENCYGDDKRKMISALITELAPKDMPETLFYTDDHSDIPTLEATDRGVAVNPTAKLRHYAESRDTVEIATWQ